MKKSEYDIDINMAAANKLAAARWQSAKERQGELHSVYDIRLDKDKRKHFGRWLVNGELKKILTSEYNERDWQSLLIGHKVRTFVGFVNRILKQKDKSYFIELKGINQESFDIETDWHGFMGLNPNLPSIKKHYRYAYQPYIPGSIVTAQYLELDSPDTNWEMTVHLHIKTENNEHFGTT